MKSKQYLGDSVYVEWVDGARMLVLTTENGAAASNTILLELDVLNALCRYLDVEKKQAGE